MIRRVIPIGPNTIAPTADFAGKLIKIGIENEDTVLAKYLHENV